MALVRIHNETRGADLAERARWADRFWFRLRGLLRRKSLPQGEGVVVVPCSSVHTFFLPFPIDIVYLDGERTVVKTVSDLKPFRACAGGRGAQYAVEVPAGTVRESGTSVGDRLRFEEA